MRGLACVASRHKVDVDMFHKSIHYVLEKLGKSKFRFERTAVSNFKSKRHKGSGNELVDYSRAPWLGAEAHKHQSAETAQYGLEIIFNISLN